MKYLNLSKVQTRNKPGRIFKKFMPILTVAAVIFLGVFVFALLKGPGQSFRFIFQGEYLRSTNGKVNVLLLGNAGGAHQGASLTDTVMVASFNLKTNQVNLVSLPRDLWVDEAKTKLNAIYEIGEAKNGGLSLAKSVVEDILGIPIHYGLRVDFGGFVKAVDLLGGIEVGVERSFEDSLYPIGGRENDLCGLEEKEIDFSEEEAKKKNIPAGKHKVLIDKEGKVATDSAEPDKGFEYFPCRYEYISFMIGLTSMDGETALKFVRSRMGTNGEGSDFARSRRQQRVLEAFKKKALSLETLISPSKISALVDTFGKSVETDIAPRDIPHFYNLTQKVGQVKSFALSTGKDGLLTNPAPQDFGGAWVLLPKNGNFDEIHRYTKKVLAGEVSDEASASAWGGSY